MWWLNRQSYIAPAHTRTHTHITTTSFSFVPPPQYTDLADMDAKLQAERAARVACK